MRVVFWPFLVVLTIAISSCQTTNEAGRSGANSYNIFFTQADHVKQLLDEKKPLQASHVYNEHTSFFIGKGNVYNDLLTRLRRDVEANVASKTNPVLTQLMEVGWPAEPAQWPTIKQRLIAAKSVLKDAESHEILYWQSPAPILLHLKNGLSAREKSIEDHAGKAFLSYGLRASPKFQDAYPTEVAVGSVIEKNEEALLKLVAQLSTDELPAVYKKYGTFLTDALRRSITARHFDLTKKQLLASGKSRVSALVETIRKTQSAGIPLYPSQAVSVRVVDISSRTLAKAGQFDFPVELKTDLPVKIKQTTLDEALSSPGSEDVVLLLDVGAARAEREIDTYKQIPSEQKIGTKSVPNPGYSTAQNQVTQAQMNVQSAQMGKVQADSQYCANMGCVFVKAIAQAAAMAEVNKANDALTSAMSNFQTTPMMLEEPVFAAYTFRSAAVAVEKSAVVNYYVIDRLAGRYLKDSFDAEEKRNFKVPYGISANDRHRERHLADHDAEKDVVAFEAASMKVPLDALLDQFIATEAEATQLPDEVALRHAIVEDKNIALSKFQADRVREATNTQFSKLAESVVAVFHPDGRSMGSGFYVNDDLVLTNQHVVGDAKFVELKRKDGQESFGKVLDRDIRRDLALLRVESRGSPVAFYNHADMPIGETVIAIGHPRGLEFSVSRGVVSAIRQIAGNEAGGNKIWHIQTDTSINPGNSGGPLFLDGKVVGVNTWALREGKDSGLNFALHFKEVLEFLKKNSVEIRWGTDGKDGGGQS
jgi:serine protease Do